MCILILLVEGQKLWTSELCSPLQPPVFSFHFSSNVLSTLSPNTRLFKLERIGGGEKKTDEDVSYQRHQCSFLSSSSKCSSLSITLLCSVNLFLVSLGWLLYPHSRWFSQRPNLVFLSPYLCTPFHPCGAALWFLSLNLQLVARTRMRLWESTSAPFLSPGIRKKEHEKELWTRSLAFKGNQRA
jgi:hypothetical protein